MGDKTDFLTLKEAAKLYGTSVNTLRRRIKEGKLPSYMPFGELLLKIEDIEKYIKKTIKISA